MQYSAEIGQSEHDKLVTAKGPTLKIGKDFKLVEYLEKAIGKYGQSPYAAIQNITNQRLHFETSICFKTVYNYLDNNLFINKLCKYNIGSIIIQERFLVVFQPIC